MRHSLSFSLIPVVLLAAELALPTSAFAQSAYFAAALPSASASPASQSDADKRQEIEDKISNLQSDIDLLNHDITSAQNGIDQLNSCTGFGAAICQIGVAKFQRQINKDKAERSSKQQEIAQLRAEEQSLGGNTAAPTDLGSSGGTYSGPNSELVQQILSRTPGTWGCPATREERPTAQPIQPDDLPCMRDKYVWAGVLQAWAAECHARLGMESEAEENASAMAQSLSSARNLCSNRPVIAGGNACSTLSIYQCP